MPKMTLIIIYFYKALIYNSIITDDIVLDWNENELQIQELNIDISKAYDSVIHEINMNNMIKYYHPLHWKFIYNRYKTLKYIINKNELYSEKIDLKKALIQGAENSENEFCVYLIILHRMIKALQNAFMDDQKLYGYDPIETQNILDQLKLYTEKIGFTIQPLKTKIINYSNKDNNNEYTFIYNGIKINTEDQCKYLGVNKDNSKDPYTIHITITIDKINKTVKWLHFNRIINYKLKYKKIILLYNGLLKSLILHSCCIINPTDKQIYKLNKSMMNIFKISFNLNKNYDVNGLMYLFKIPTIKYNIIICHICSFWKILYHKSNIILKKLIHILTKHYIKSGICKSNYIKNTLKYIKNYTNIKSFNLRINKNEKEIKNDLKYFKKIVQKYIFKEININIDNILIIIYHNNDIFNKFNDILYDKNKEDINFFTTSYLL